MAISLNNILLLFLKIAIVLTPLASLPYFTNIFRQLSLFGSFYPIFIGMFFFVYYLTKTKKIYLPKNNSFYLVLFFVVWIFLSGLVNVSDMISSNTKGRNGFEKFFFQTLLLLFMIYVSIFIFNVFRVCKTKENILVTLRKYILFSFLLTGFYSFFETLNMFNISFAREFISILDPLLRMENAHKTLRISSLCSEPSHFAMYLAFVSPWVLSYLITQENKKIYALLSVYLVVLSFLTFSRTAYVIFSIQILLFMSLFYKEVFNHRNMIFVLCLLLFMSICLISIQNFMDDKDIFFNRTYWHVLESLLTYDVGVSNIMRSGIQIAAFNMFLDYPVFGIGLGQYLFYIAEYMPAWAYVIPETYSVINSSPDGGRTVIPNIYIRFLAETGLIGLILWLSIWAFLLYELLCIVKISSPQTLIFLKTLIISIIGSLLAGFNYDLISFWGYWILLGISWSCKKNLNVKSH